MSGKSREGERGATMLETAMVVVCFFLLLGAIFDLGVALYQFSMLRHVTNLAARDIPVDLANLNFRAGATCGDFDQTVDNYLQKASNSLRSGGKATSQVAWTTCVRTAGVPIRAFRVHAEMPVQCFFLCRFFGNAWRLHSDSFVTLDNGSIPACEQEPNCHQFSAVP